MIYWTFLDFYIGEENQVTSWIASLPPSETLRVRSKLNTLLLEHRRVATLPVRKFKPLEKGIGEIRFEVGNVQYRPLYTVGPEKGQITLLYMAKEKGGKFIPRDAIERAVACAVAMKLTGNVREHDYAN
jgi:hypothetical protein